jgi:SAM-dependent methyltransferase
MADDATYVIRSGVGALERLELIARLCAPATLAFLGRTGALGAPRFLDVGCGVGDVAVQAAAAGTTDAVGVDVNPDVVAGATARAARLGSTARFVTGSFADVGTGDLADFDVVYARCVLSHLPDPQPAVAAMVRAVRPGGLVLVEDVEVAAVWSSPVEPALVRHVELYVAAARAIGARPDVVPDLAGALRAAGAEAVEVDVVQPVLRDPADLRIHARTMEAIADPVLARGLATADEIDAVVARLEAWADEPGVVATLPRFVQVAGRRPA